MRFKIFRINIRLSDSELETLRVIGEPYDEPPSKVLFRLVTNTTTPPAMNYRTSNNAPKKHPMTFLLTDDSNATLQKLAKNNGGAVTATISSLIADLASGVRRVDYPDPSVMRETEIRQVQNWGPTYPRGARNFALREIEKRYQRRVARQAQRVAV